jgi:hypothetical protein
MPLVSTIARSRIESWLVEHADEAVLRWLFGAMLVGTATVLALDFAALNAQETTRTSLPRTSEPLPSSRPDGDEGAPLPRPDGALKRGMSFDLVGDGRLMAVGAIEPGTADAFAAEVKKRGSYIKTVVLQSPGGSVTDALEMGRLIRQKQFATEVEAGRLCASSCPLVFAGGKERRAGDKAGIGVHQVSALAQPGAPPATPGGGMGSAQRISAECQRYLREMGIDLQVWIHAMETPKERLYYFKPAELLALKLVTEPARSEKAGAVGAKS